MNFTTAAQLVQRRLFWLRGFQWWRRQSLSLAVVLLLLAVHRWHYGSSLWPALACAGSWFSVGLYWSWLNGPGDYAAMAYWGSKLGVGEGFAAAWSFEQQAQRTAAEQQHWDVQALNLADHCPAKELPLKLPAALLWPLLAGCLVAVAQQLRLPQKGDELVNAQAVSQLQERVQQLAQQMAKPQSALSAAEQAAVEKLKQDVQAMAEGLNQTGETSAKQLLTSVEKQARYAERLADRLAASSQDGWASAALLAALGRQANTQVLAEELAKKRPLPAAKYAESLAQALAAPTSTEVTSRSLQDSTLQADSSDTQRIAGRRLLDADKALRSQRVDLAVNELQALAKDLQHLAKRQEAQKQMQVLADSLREAAAQATGQAANSAIAEVEQADASSNGASSPTQASSLQQRPTDTGLQETQSPTASPPGDSASQQIMISNQQVPLSNTPTEQSSDQKKPLLVAPVPGQQQQTAPAQSLSLSMPGANADAKTTTRSGGGLAPSNATAPLKGVATQQQKAHDSSTVTAASDNQGASSVRQTIGSLHNEASQLKSQLTSAEFIATQEAAMNDMALPPSRRAQVLRYLTQLRKQLEKAP